MTFTELNQLYLSSLRGRSCYQEYTRIYIRNFANWTEHPTRGQMVRWAEHEDQKKSPIHTNKRVGYIKSMYNWAIRKLGDDDQPLWSGGNPAISVEKYPAYSRERTMIDSECQLLVKSLDMFPHQFRVVLIVLLTTGCRVGEAIKMEWSHIDLEYGVWRKPTTKNGRPQRIPLPRQAREAIKTLPRSCQYVFVGQYQHHLSRNAVDKQWRRVRDELRMGGEDAVRIHDFRRTVASRLLDEVVNDRILKSVLNHYNGDVTSIYARASFDTQAKALQKLADGLFSQPTIHQEGQHGAGALHARAVLV
jgi:integrase